MTATMPAIWFDTIPSAPAGVGSVPLAMLVLLGLLCATVALLVRSARGAPPTAPMTTATFDGYRRFLLARDGTADLRRHRLARREVFFAALDAAPLCSQATVDAAVFHRNLARRRPERGLDARMLWLLASAKANQAERFGVGFSELYGRVPSEDEDVVRVHLHLQETYHTRILADVVALFGLTVRNSPPPLWTRTLIKLMALSPPAWVMPLIGCSEMIGCVMFRALRDRGLALTADEPAIAARVRLLYDEILADEISHVGFVAAQLGPSGRTVMRTLYRCLALPMVRQMPELLQLFGLGELAQRFRAFRLEDMLAEFPDTAYAAAMP